MYWTKRLFQVLYSLGFLAVVYTLTMPSDSGAQQSFRPGGAKSMPATPPGQILNPAVHNNGALIGGVGPYGSYLGSSFWVSPFGQILPIPNPNATLQGFQSAYINGTFYLNGGGYSNGNFVNGGINGPGYINSSTYVGGAL